MKRPVVIRPDDLDWKKHFTQDCDVPLFEKILLQDPDSGMEVNLAHYPAGYTTVLHRHTCSHGMYVLQGRLQTSEGMVEQGEFIWFPAGTEMEHGAPEEQDCTVLFITNGSFDIEYLPDTGSDEREERDNA